MSRSKLEDGPYHHGDLRNALIAAGVEMLAEQGADNLSLRKLARQAGVSHNAPYMHFSDKEALLAAIAQSGFEQLTVDIDEAVAGAGEHWQAQFEAASWAYVNFALEHPSLLQLMFSPYDSSTYPSLRDASTGALNRLSRLIGRGQQQGLLKAGDSKEIATYVWSLLHGLSTILTNQKMPPDVMGERSPRELTAGYLQLVYAGLERD